MHIDQRLIDFVTGLLNKEIPPTYFYHNTDHTLYVLEKTQEIAKAENCSPAELRLLETAALWHDTGYIHSYHDHEEKGCRLARQYLPEFGYGDEAIHRVCGMIMATKIPQSPTNKLEDIVADADLEYLGTDRAAAMSNNMYRERKEIEPSLSPEEWKKAEIDFLQRHHYFTTYCKVHKAPIKNRYLKQLIGGII